jgi:drug/metabolite transporter (DMT)-like permease
MMLTQSASNRAYLALAAAMTIVGSSVVSGKVMIESFPIFIASTLRFAIAVLLLVAIMTVRHHPFPLLSLKTHLILVLQAATGIVLFNALLLAGLERTTAAASGIITSATPVMILLFSTVLGERLRFRPVLSIGIATAGLLVLNLFGAGGSDATGNHLLGGLLVLGAVIGEALYTILGKAVSGGLAPLAQTLWVSLYGLAMFIPFALWELPGFDLAQTRASGWAAVVYSAVLVTVVAFSLWFYGLQRVPANRAGIFTGMIPVSAVILAAFMLHERIGWPHVFGIGCVLVAIALIASERQPEAVTTPLPG